MAAIAIDTMLDTTASIISACFTRSLLMTTGCRVICYIIVIIIQF